MLCRAYRNQGLAMFTARGLLLSMMLIGGNVLLPANGQVQAASTQAKTDKSSKSYYKQGREIANRLIKTKKLGQQKAKDDLLRGVSDVLSGTRSGFSKKQKKALLEALKKAIADDEVAQQESVEPARGNQFVDDYANLNAERPEVQKTASGLQYEVLRSGNGAQPSEADNVLVNYKGSLSNGTVFDSTYGKGEAAPLKMSEIVVPGLKEALLLMHEGDKWRVVIPPKLGFINFGNNRLRRRDLIYEIELVEVQSPQ